MRKALCLGVWPGNAPAGREGPADPWGAWWEGQGQARRVPSLICCSLTERLSGLAWPLVAIWATVTTQQSSLNPLATGGKVPPRLQPLMWWVSSWALRVTVTGSHQAGDCHSWGSAGLHPWPFSTMHDWETFRVGLPTPPDCEELLTPSKAEESCRETSTNQGVGQSLTLQSATQAVIAHRSTQ